MRPPVIDGGVDCAFFRVLAERRSAQRLETRRERLSPRTWNVYRKHRFPNGLTRVGVGRRVVELNFADPQCVKKVVAFGVRMLLWAPLGVVGNDFARGYERFPARQNKSAHFPTFGNALARLSFLLWSVGILVVD